jgi:hypothetical protein
LSENDTMSGNAGLLADVVKWKAKAREYKVKAEAAESAVAAKDQRIKSLEGENATLAKGVEDAEAKAKHDPDGLRAEAERLRGELWNRDARSKFDKVAKDAKVRDDALDDLWSLVGLKRDPENELTDDAIKERVAEAVKARSYLVQSDPETGSGAAGAAQGRPGSGAGAIAPKPPGPGVGRGAPERASVGASVEGIIASKFADSGRSDPFRIA